MFQCSSNACTISTKGVSLGSIGTKIAQGSISFTQIARLPCLTIRLISFCFLAAPSASPANVRGNSTSTSIFVQWEQVPSPYQNGVILYYTVTYYRWYYSRFPRTVIVLAPTTQTTLTGLNHSTVYSISVSASTSKGYGPAAYINIATGRNTEFLFSLLDLNGETKITMKKGKNLKPI